jgi:hypothetical protein
MSADVSGQRWGNDDYPVIGPKDRGGELDETQVLAYPAQIRAPR